MMEPIRILHILHSMNRGGAENAIMNYYRHLDRDYIQFDFLLTDASKSFFEDDIVSLGGRVFRVPRLTMTNPFPYVIGIKRFLKAHPEYTIVHSHTSSKSVLPLAIARVMGVAIRCCHSHTSSTEAGWTGVVRNVLKPLLKLVATDYLACGEQAGEWLYGRCMCQCGQVLIFKNVIEADKFRLNLTTRKKYRERYGISDDTLVLGHTARFSAVKNHMFDIEILHCLRNRDCKVKLLLVGGGELETEIKAKAKEKGLIDDVIFAGIVPNVYDYEQAMDVFLLPSYYEGLPLSIVEAQVSGLPCLTTEGKVSSECSVTSLVTYLPLELGAEAWASKIWNAWKVPRFDHYTEIVNAGYDAKSSAKFLQEFYLRRYRETVRG